MMGAGAAEGRSCMHPYFTSWDPAQDKCPIQSTSIELSEIQENEAGLKAALIWDPTNSYYPGPTNLSLYKSPGHVLFLAPFQRAAQCSGIQSIRGGKWMDPEEEIRLKIDGCEPRSNRTDFWMDANQPASRVQIVRIIWVLCPGGEKNRETFTIYEDKSNRIHLLMKPKQRYLQQILDNAVGRKVGTQAEANPSAWPPAKPLIIWEVYGWNRLDAGHDLSYRHYRIKHCWLNASSMVGHHWARIQFALYNKAVASW